MNVVWFKRDLRLVDHEPIIGASRSGMVLPLYIFEPKLWKEPDMSGRHFVFLCECLEELNKTLFNEGQQLIIKIGDAVEILSSLNQRHQITALWSHQETWNNWTYKRDLVVKQWCKSVNIPWYEPTQNGVIRCLNDRNGWGNRWYKQMKKPMLNSPPKLKPIGETSQLLPTADSLGLKPNDYQSLQKGGRSEGLKLLKSFLYLRGNGYTKEMSSPVTAYSSCSRLSAHLAFGTVSIREVFQATEYRIQEIKNLPRDMKGKWPNALRSFSGRLRWHCHFIQKLEDEPRIEFENLHPVYNGLRESEFNENYFEAWKSGRTGYPMVDACMRALTATGWLNFRMRAMLMSFASYHLWLHWRKTALHLANLFTDYEPGIHYNQTQMQSGTTGINAIRIYNPIKQGLDHDPEGKFIRQWIPELKGLKKAYVHTPWLVDFKLNDYPMPIINEKIARKNAIAKIYGLHKSTVANKEITTKIVKKHGSRKSGLQRTVDKKRTKLGPLISSIFD